MQAEVTVLTRRGAAVMRRSDTVTGEAIRFGRGTDNEVPLPDIRVELTAAVLRQHTDGLLPPSPPLQLGADTPSAMRTAIATWHKG